MDYYYFPATLHHSDTVPPGTPRCDCGCVLLPYSSDCPMCTASVGNAPLEVTGSADPGDVLDTDRTPF